MTTADAHPDIKWLDDLSCLLDGEGRNNDTSTVEVATYMTSGQYEFVRERYSYIVIRTSPKGNGHYFHQVSEKPTGPDRSRPAGPLDR
jgi:hypothetical protein